MSGSSLILWSYENVCKQNKNDDYLTTFKVDPLMSNGLLWALNVSVPLRSMAGQKTDILICVLKMNEALTGLEWHEG